MTSRFALILAGAVWLSAAAPALAVGPGGGLDRTGTPSLLMKVQDDLSAPDPGTRHSPKRHDGVRRSQAQRTNDSVDVDRTYRGPDGNRMERGHDRWKEKKKHFDSLPAEEQQKIRERMKEHRARREEMKEKLMALPPEERHQKMQELREKFGHDHEAFRKERREKFEERWKNATPEQKEKFCGNVKTKCAESGGEGYGCKAAREACGSL